VDLAFDERLASCPLCGSAELSPSTLAIERCRACGLRFMNPQVADVALARFTGDERGELEPRNFELLRRYVDGVRFLAIGCEDGRELALARDHGFEPEGHAADPGTAARIASTTGFRVASGDLFRLELPRDHYDCVFLDQVLDRVKNPADTLRLVRSILRLGGVCYLGLPNRGTSLPPGRLHSYSPRCLAKVLPEVFGFEVLAIRGDPPSEPGGWRYALKRSVPSLASRMIVLARRPLEGEVTPLPVVELQPTTG
jgi:SAM-dependent methyltransferase